MDCWIRVDRRLPEPYHEVLVYCPEYGGEAYFARVDELGGWMTRDADPIKPTHWMPKPEAPTHQ